MKNSFKQYEKVIIKELLNTKDKVVIQLGHFSLIANNKGELIPAIIENITDTHLREFVNDSEYMGDFPSRTFNSGLNIANKLRLKKIKFKFSIIVNDWQWINKGIYDNKKTRTEYYLKKDLPSHYLNLLNNNNYNLNDFICTDDYTQNNPFNSELKLRKKGKKNESLCSPTTCATEYYPYLNRVLEQNDTLISYIPLSCKIPILFSSKKFLSESIIEKKIIHIFYNPLDESFELSILTKGNLTNENGKKIDLDFMKSVLMSK